MSNVSPTAGPPGASGHAAAAPVPRTRWLENPFFVLGLPTDASRAEVERAAQKLLGLLEIGAAAVRRYDTPFGPQERTPERVRFAAAELRDPARRIAHELWARPVPPPPRESEVVTWPDARRDVCGMKGLP